MDIFEVMKARHSVRSYTDERISPETAALLQEELDLINAEGGVHFQLFVDEPTGFSGKLKNVKNYIAFVAEDKDGADERIGYYGARIMLYAQSLGINSCWVAMSFNKGTVASLCELAEGERPINALALGYGVTQGKPHRSKSMARLCECDTDMPDWFRRGMEAAMLAPTAINQQQFKFILKDGKLTAKAKIGPCNKIDLGIVKYCFEQGADGKCDLRP